MVIIKAILAATVAVFCVASTILDYETIDGSHEEFFYP
jgi:hypothetical protein